MAMKSGITAGILVGVVDVLIFQHFVPNVTDVRAAPPMDNNIENLERKALIGATIFTLIVAGFARSAEVFAIGGFTIVATDFTIKHANAVNPATGKVQQPIAAGQANTYNMPDYTS